MSYYGLCQLYTSCIKHEIDVRFESGVHLLTTEGKLHQILGCTIFVSTVYIMRYVPAGVIMAVPKARKAHRVLLQSPEHSINLTRLVFLLQNTMYDI